MSADAHACSFRGAPQRAGCRRPSRRARHAGWYGWCRPRGRPRLTHVCAHKVLAGGRRRVGVALAGHVAAGRHSRLGHAAAVAACRRRTRAQWATAAGWAAGGGSGGGGRAQANPLRSSRAPAQEAFSDLPRSIAARWPPRFQVGGPPQTPPCTGGREAPWAACTRTHHHLSMCNRDQAAAERCEQRQAGHFARGPLRSPLSGECLSPGPFNESQIGFGCSPTKFKRWLS